MEWKFCWVQESNMRYIAVFDILGFKNLILNNKLEDVYDILKKTFYDVDSLQHNILSKDKVKSCGYLDYIIFSDTIIFYTEGISGEEFEGLVETSQYFLASTFSNGMPVRGCITKGEFYKENVLFFGKGLVEAYLSGESQQWAGAYIKSECITYIKDQYQTILDSHLKNGSLM